MATFPEQGPEPLILASTSAARRALLANAGLTVETRPPGVDEAEVKASLVLDGAKPADLARLLGELKAQAVSRACPGHVVIGGDQVLSFNNRVFDKPVSRADALDQLTTLRGQRHELISSVAVYRDDERLWSTVDRARLTMRPVSDATLEAYCTAMGERVTQTVGGYQLEGLGVHLFDRVEGDYFTVLGLPLLLLLGYLRQYGALVE